MNKNIWGVLITFGVMAGLALASCELFYPPVFYQKIVNSSANNSSNGSGGTKSWKNAGTISMALSSSITPVLRVDSAGVPCILTADSTGNAIFWSYNAGSWGSLQAASPSIAAIDFTYINGTVPYFLFSSNNSLIIVTNTATPYQAPGGSYYGPGPVSIISTNGVPIVAFCYNNLINFADNPTNAWPIPTTFNNTNLCDLLQIKYSAPNFYVMYRGNKSSTTGLYIRASINLLGLQPDSGETTLTNYVDGGTNASMTTWNGKAYISYLYGHSPTMGSNINVVSYDGTTVTPSGIIQQNSELYTPSIAVLDAAHIYVAFSEQNGTFNTIKVFMYDGSAWSQLGGDIDDGSGLCYPRLDLAPDGTPYVAYVTPSGISVKAYR